MPRVEETTEIVSRSSGTARTMTRYYAPTRRLDHASCIVSTGSRTIASPPEERTCDWRFRDAEGEAALRSVDRGPWRSSCSSSSSSRHWPERCSGSSPAGWSTSPPRCSCTGRTPGATWRGSRILPGTLEEVAAVEGVGSAAPLAENTFTVRAGGELQDAALFGYELGGPGAPTRLSEGRLPQTDGEAVASSVDAGNGFGSARSSRSSPAVLDPRRWPGGREPVRRPANAVRLVRHVRGGDPGREPRRAGRAALTRRGPPRAGRRARGPRGPDHP